MKSVLLHAELDKSNYKTKDKVQALEVINIRFQMNIIESAIKKNESHCHS